MSNGSQEAKGTARGLRPRRPQCEVALLGAHARPCGPQVDGKVAWVSLQPAGSNCLAIAGAILRKYDSFQMGIDGLARRSYCRSKELNPRGGILGCTSTARLTSANTARMTAAAGRAMAIPVLFVVRCKTENRSRHTHMYTV